MKLKNLQVLENFDSDRHPVLSGGLYKFWLVTGATKNSTLIDVITEVDIKALYNIARGTDHEEDKEVELFPYEKKQEALALAKKRLAKAKNN
jgi:hypothetical protein